MGCHFLPQGDFPNPGMELWPPALWADYLLSETQGKSTLLLIEYNKNDGISLPRLGFCDFCLASPLLRAGALLTL